MVLVMGPLADTNILLRLAEPSNTLFPISDAAITHFIDIGEKLCIVPQNIVEFRAVATRPSSERGVLALTFEQAYGMVEGFLELFMFLPDSPSIRVQWQDLV